LGAALATVSRADDAARAGLLSTTTGSPHLRFELGRDDACEDVDSASRRVGHDERIARLGYEAAVWGERGRGGKEDAQGSGPNGA